MRVRREKRWQANKPRGCKARAIARAAVAAVALAIATPALADDTWGGAHQASTKWWECMSNVKADGHAYICCTVGDGHVLGPDDWQLRGDGHYWVRLSDDWHQVPTEAITHVHECGPDPNPGTRGLAKVWWGMGVGPVEGRLGAAPVIYCFLPGTEY